MTIFLYVLAGIYAVLLLGTLAFSGDRLATGIRGTVRQGILGVTFAMPFALVLGIFGVCVYAVVSTAIYFWTH